MPVPPSLRPPWFTALANAYSFLDTALQQEVERQNRPLACAPGCHACCLQPIPLTLAEAMGIKAYRAACGAGPAAEARLDRCPFLDRGRCSIYPVRPFACRRYLVFDTACVPGEEPLETRPGDVHHPSESALLHALNMTLPAYDAAGIAHAEREDRAFFTGHTVLIQQMRWGEDLDAAAEQKTARDETVPA